MEPDDAVLAIQKDREHFLTIMAVKVVVEQLEDVLAMGDPPSWVLKRGFSNGHELDSGDAGLMDRIGQWRTWHRGCGGKSSSGSGDRVSAWTS